MSIVHGMDGIGLFSLGLKIQLSHWKKSNCIITQSHKKVLPVTAMLPPSLNKLLIVLDQQSIPPSFKHHKQYLDQQSFLSPQSRKGVAEVQTRILTVIANTKLPSRVHCTDVARFLLFLRLFSFCQLPSSTFQNYPGPSPSTSVACTKCSEASYLCHLFCWIPGGPGGPWGPGGQEQCFPAPCCCCCCQPWTFSGCTLWLVHLLNRTGQCSWGDLLI